MNTGWTKPREEKEVSSRRARVFNMAVGGRNKEEPMEVACNSNGGVRGGDQGIPPSEQGLAYADTIRRRLLVHIHIAKRDLEMTDEHYRIMLESLFGISTAAALSIQQLNYVVDVFKQMGWRPYYVDFKKKDIMVGILRKRAIEIAAQIPNGEKRLQGLTKSICRVEKLEWCKDEAKLKKVLAAIGNVARKEKESIEAN